jgi:hypothetical protein
MQLRPRSTLFGFPKPRAMLLINIAQFAKNVKLSQCAATAIAGSLDDLTERP